eukprot:359151-Chlamydomonas_euryale.AAC.6
MCCVGDYGKGRPCDPSPVPMGRGDHVTQGGGGISDWGFGRLWDRRLAAPQKWTRVTTNWPRCAV